MGWLAELEAVADQARPAKRAPRLHTPRPAITRIFLQVRPPSAVDAGEVEESYFIVVNDKVTITDRDGHAVQGIKPHTLRDGDLAASIAHAMARAARIARLGLGEFNRPLSYGANGVA